MGTPESFNFCAQDLDFCNRSIRGSGLHIPHLLYNGHSVCDAPEDRVLPVQEGGRSKSDEELGTVCVRTGVSHRDNPSASVLQLRV